MDDKQMSASLDTDIFDDISSLQNKNNILFIYSDWEKNVSVSCPNFS